MILGFIIAFIAGITLGVIGHSHISKHVEVKFK